MEWVKSMPSNSGMLVGASVTSDLSGNVISTGSLKDTIDFNLGVGSYVLVSEPYLADVYIQKLDVNRNFIWAKSIGGNSSDFARSIITDSLGNVYVVGRFLG